VLELSYPVGVRLQLLLVDGSVSLPFSALGLQFLELALGFGGGGLGLRAGVLHLALPGGGMGCV
jgi:hypothetical protein